jgi:hypothetical protein
MLVARIWLLLYDDIHMYYFGVLLKEENGTLSPTFDNASFTDERLAVLCTCRCILLFFSFTRGVLVELYVFQLRLGRSQKQHVSRVTAGGIRAKGRRYNSS